MKIISISNIKGGVGKTTTASVLAVGLVGRGYRVLLIDSDPQTNLTMCFIQEQVDERPSLYHVYSNGEAVDNVKMAIKDNLDLIIGDFELCNADMQFTKAGRLKMLKKAIKNINGEYDFVIIDTPPNLGILSLNAFLASDYVLVPMSADSFSLKGVRLLKETLDDVADETEKELPVAGILLTRYNSRTNVSKLLEKSLNSAAELLGTKILKTELDRQWFCKKAKSLRKICFRMHLMQRCQKTIKGLLMNFWKGQEGEHGRHKYQIDARDRGS